MCPTTLPNLLGEFFPDIANVTLLATRYRFCDESCLKHASKQRNMLPSTYVGKNEDLSTNGVVLFIKLMKKGKQLKLIRWKTIWNLNIDENDIKLLLNELQNDAPNRELTIDLIGYPRTTSIETSNDPNVNQKLTVNQSTQIRWKKIQTCSKTINN